MIETIFFDTVSISRPLLSTLIFKTKEDKKVTPLIQRCIDNVVNFFNNVKKIRIDVKKMSFYYPDADDVVMRSLLNVTSIEIIAGRYVKIANYESLFNGCRYIKDRVKNVKLINPASLDITQISNLFDLNKFSIFQYDLYHSISLNNLYIRCKRLYFNVDYYDNVNDVNDLGFVIDDICKEVSFGPRFDIIRNNYKLPINVKNLTICVEYSDSYYRAFYNLKNTNLHNITHLNICLQYSCEYVTMGINAFFVGALSNIFMMDWVDCPNLKYLVMNGNIMPPSKDYIAPSLRRVTFNQRFWRESEFCDLKNADVEQRPKNLETVNEYIGFRTRLYGNYLNKPFRLLPNL